MQLAEFDAEQTGEESQWQAAGDSENASPAPARTAPAPGSIPWRETFCSASCSIAELTHLPVEEFAAALRKFKLAGRELEIALNLFAES